MENSEIASKMSEALVKAGMAVLFGRMAQKLKWVMMTPIAQSL